MSINKPSQRVRKKDFVRVLLTETCPYETPVIFDNFGLYKQIQRLAERPEDIKKLITHLLTDPKEPKFSIPYVYNIRKDSESPRTLSLIHPRSQLHFVELYRKFDNQILLCCTKSKFSLRAPLKVTSKYFIKNQQENIKKYRSDIIASTESELSDRHLTSYFAYGENTRLHKFFESFDYLSLEKKYSQFWSMDISKCFDSIYTHSIAWAIKTKEYTKRHIGIDGVFGDIFDTTMRCSNYNETAGIPIGPEISRIFAEIIFQEIDERVEKKLLSRGYIVNTHYTIRRYVDDFFIFSNSNIVSNQVAHAIEAECKAYKLNINESKTLKAERPFITSKTKSLRSVQRRLASLKESLFEGEDYGSPRKLSNQKTLTLHFIDDIKAACSSDPDAYQLISSYVVGWLSNRVISATDENINRTNLEPKLQAFTNFYSFTIRAIFHFYSINPSHRSSVKLCTAVKLACMFYEKHMPYEVDNIKTLVYQLCKEFFTGSGHLGALATDRNASLLEAMNILALCKELGPQYFLPKEALHGIAKLSSDEHLNYFEIISLLYYIGEEPFYIEAKNKIQESIKHHLVYIDDIRVNSHKIHLVLDLLTCPYLDIELRKETASRLYELVHNSKPGKEKLKNLLTFFDENIWFVNWRSFDLLTALEKKELLSGY
ncbi:antiviral reverse transcriptase Drt3b [Pseudomonas aeruginosa]|uniref:antiviral reverse transcriptase Drt3b n=1 Tax=Pseudomonas aeruginosa TaxID=287 RepID=UPI000F819C1C|nr:antiviral reverse transcriptase Drt3b [Pseudomonas aeruginosa]RTS12268.1 RNA-directed DNA polymerase [Pseudomonas aeruginosa]